VDDFGIRGLLLVVFGGGGLPGGDLVLQEARESVNVVGAGLLWTAIEGKLDVVADEEHR